MAQRATIHTEYRLGLLMARLDDIGAEWLENRVRGRCQRQLEEELAEVQRASRRTEERLRRAQRRG